MSSPKDPVKRDLWIKHQSESHIGKPRGEFTIEHRKNLSKALIGNKNPNYGKVISKETRRRMSKSHLGKTHSTETRRKMSEVHRGDKCNLWKGGISFEPYCPKFNKSFKNRVRAFFNHICVECGMTRKENKRELDVHHVNYDKMMCCNDVKPLFVALCHSHNTIANSDRGFWEDWYTEIINEFYDGRCYSPLP